MFNPVLMSVCQLDTKDLSPTLLALGVDGFSAFRASGSLDQRKVDPREGGNSREVFLSRVREFYIQKPIGADV